MGKGNGRKFNYIKVKKIEPKRESKTTKIDKCDCCNNEATILIELHRYERTKEEQEEIAKTAVTFKEKYKQINIKTVRLCGEHKEMLKDFLAYF